MSVVRARRKYNIQYLRLKPENDQNILPFLRNNKYYNEIKKHKLIK